MQYYDAVYYYLNETLLQRPAIQELLNGKTDDSALCRGIEEIHRVLPILLCVGYANHPYNRRKSNLADKMGISQILAIVDAIIDSGNYALSAERHGALADTLELMRQAITKSA